MLNMAVSLALRIAGRLQWYAQATLPIVNTMAKIAQRLSAAKRRLRQKVSLAARFLKPLYL